MKKIILLALILTTILNAGNSSKFENIIESAWQSVAQNDFVKAEQLFLEANTKDKNNPRPYLALAYIKQLQEKNIEAWTWYDKALKNLENPYPYIYAAELTEKGLFSPEINKEQGLIKIFPDLTDNMEIDATMRACAQEYMGRFEEEYGSLKKADNYFDMFKAITDWMIIGPFENISASGFEKVFMPEKEFKVNAVYEGKSGIPASWFKAQKVRRDKWVDFTRYFAHNNSIFYGNTFVYSPKEQVVQIRVGTSGSLKTFLNDQLILSNFDENNNDLDTYVAETKLDAGWNRILVKCGYSEISQCNFLLRLTDTNGHPLQNIKISSEAEDYTKHQDLPVKEIRNFAELYFEKIIKDNPQQIENYLLLADTYLRNDKAIEAELVLLDAHKQMPNSVLIKSHLIEAYTRGEKYDEVNSTFAKIYELYPDVPFVIEHKFSEYQKNQNLDKTEEMVEKYAQLLPQSANALMMQMTLAFLKGDANTALEILNSTYEKYPNKWDVVYLAALFAYRTTQSYDKTIEIYSKYIDYRRLDNAYIQLGDSYLKASKVDAFEETFNELIKNDPAATGIYYSLARVFHQLQNYDKAEHYINESIKLCPNHAVYWAKLGEIKQESGDKSEAISAYQKALKYSPTDYDSRYRIRELQDKKSIFEQFASEDIDELIANAPTATDYPEDDAVFLLDDQRRVVYEKGTSEIQNEVLVKVFNADGIDNFKEYWLSFNSYSEKLIIEEAVVKKVGGTEIKADTDDNLVVFKSLEANDCIYIKWRVQNYNQGRLSPHFWDEIYFNYFYPAEHIRYSLLVPEKFEFNHKTQFMPDEPDVSKTDDGNLYVWELKKQAAVESEYNMPELDDIGKMLFISSIPNWEYLVDWYLDLAKTKTRSSYEIKNIVAQLFAENPAATKNQKINLVYNYITENINYSSVSFRQSGLIPQKARKVLVQRIGDCKDVATLCIAMLKEMEIDAHYVLVNTFDEGQNKNILPAIEFNHAIVGVETESGTLHLDLTARNYPMYSLPEMDIDAFALPIVSGTNAPVYLHKKDTKPGKTRRKSIVKLKADNSAEIQRSNEKWWLSAASIRSSYRFKGKEERIKDLTETLSDEFPNLQVKNFKISNLDTVAPNIRYDYSFEVPYFMIEASGMFLLKMPWSDNLDNRRSLSTEERKYDYIYRSYSDTLIEEMEIQLPEGLEPLEIKDKTEFKSDIADYYIEAKFENGVIKAKRTLINKMSIIPPEKYQEFKTFYNNAVRADAQQILLKKKI